MSRTNAALAREIRVIRSSFRQLASSFTKISPFLTAVPDAGAVTQSWATRRKPRLTAAHRARLKLQGRYMGTMRGLPAGKRVAVKKIRAAKGIRAAIKAAERMAV